jgi:hypothetical protein
VKVRAMAYRPRPWVSCAVILGALLSVPGVASGQADAALARQVVADVNKALPQMRAATLQAQRPEVEYKSDVKAWADAGGLRKLEVTDHDDSGDVVTEYYYADGALVFVYQAVKGFNDAGRMVTRGEERQYFRDGQMFKWLSGMEKAEVRPGDAEFADEGKARLAASAFLAKAAREAVTRRGSK